ncbi:MAG: cob(I)yrinic acid a,c-diamide adenosyltransferase [Aestuariivita sp.]|nr:cob(I)yrinic acid a,c-diamide adenosyltransferase [Aestuariivita sp.]
MVVLNKIYTKTGDRGETSLGDGTRVRKNGLRVATYGTIDELNSYVGVVRLFTKGDEDIALSRIQNELFDLGADLCRPDHKNDDKLEHSPLRIINTQVQRLEAEIDQMNISLEPLRSFILPGGSELSAHLHVCRTISRRAERLAVELAEHESVNPVVNSYLNRLSDWFFVSARIANNTGKNDILWVPGANR